MKLGYLLIFAFFTVLGIYACVKGSTGKKAQLSLESITKVVNGNDTTGQDVDSMTALFKFTNSGGTLGNGTFVSIRTRINQLILPQGDTVGADTLYSTIPDFGGVSKGEFKYVLDAQGYLSQNSTANDTFVFKFYAMTPDSIASDTITSPPVVITKP